MSEQTTPDGAESPIIVERQGRVGHIRLNRPKALNALNEATMRAVVAAVQAQGRIPSLYVNSFNLPARSVYQRIGFTEVGTFATVLVD